jgi:hypothetical protein
MTKEIELKPCPFCKQKPYKTVFNYSDIQHSNYCFLNGVGLRIYDWEVKNWNRRDK